MKEELKKGWKKIPLLYRIIILAVIAVIVFFIVRLMIVKYKAYKAEQILKGAVSVGTSNGTTFSTNYGSVAQRIYKAFYDNDIFGYSEDEEAAIIALSDVPKQFMPELKDAYFHLYSKNLNDDCIKYLGSEYSRVQNLFS